MKVSDYIVDFLINQGITDVFGYPGGMVTHLMESFRRREDRITAHVCRHEQGAAFEACGYAQVTGRPGIAYATSGPGATNLITGICDAWFDSIPAIFLTGQVNRNESCEGMGIRQRGFQETDIVSMVRGVTKLAVKVIDPDQMPALLRRAWDLSLEGRKGPVLLDIPMDILRSNIEIPAVEPDNAIIEQSSEEMDCSSIIDALNQSERPCLIAGAALKTPAGIELIRQFTDRCHIPVVTSMIAVDLLSKDSQYNMGFIGAYGNRSANFTVAKADLILSLGSRLDIRQVGALRRNFAPEATVVRVDIDPAELDYKIREDEINICADVENVLSYLVRNVSDIHVHWEHWMDVCGEIRSLLDKKDSLDTNEFTERISSYIPDGSVITTDVGQNQVWVAQSFHNKPNQRILFSGGMGAMGYSLPAAIGACIGSGRRVTVSFSGDGGIQMNIQELEVIRQEHLPVKVVVFNNHALGMIRHFQEMYFKSRYAQTTERSGYSVPDLRKIAEAYDMEYYYYDDPQQVDSAFMRNSVPAIVEIGICHNTYVMPKLRFGQPNQDQEPLIDRRLYEYIMSL